MRRRITGFHRDVEGHWVAELECGHAQHVRHDPPWQLRPWVLGEATRRQRLGTTLDCPPCDADHDRTSPPGGADRQVEARLAGRGGSATPRPTPTEAEP